MSAAHGSDWLRTGGSPPPPAPFEDWAPFRPLKQLVAPELFRRRETTSPFAGLILACRGLNLRLWFFNHAFGHVAAGSNSPTNRAANSPTASTAAPPNSPRSSRGALDHRQVAPVPPELLRDIAADESAARQVDPLVAHNIPASMLEIFGRDLETATKFHNKLFTHFGRGFGGELVNLWPGPNAAAFFDVAIRSGRREAGADPGSARSSKKVGSVCPAERRLPSSRPSSPAPPTSDAKTRPTSSTLSASSPDFAMAWSPRSSLAACPTSRCFSPSCSSANSSPTSPTSDLPLYSFAGLQAGLAIPFTFLATVGPEWGSFTTVRTRLAGLLVAGFTAVVVHAFVWPVMPIRQLRASIADALRSTADTLTQLFTAPRNAWPGPPPGLRDTILRARDLLDDARYLPGPEHADATYATILTSLQTIDASLEYIQLLICIEPDTPTREQFFATLADFPKSAREKLTIIAAQFHNAPQRTVPIIWPSDATERWDLVAPNTEPPTGSDLRRLVVIARCFDEIAAAAERISKVACEISLHTGLRHSRQ